MPTNSNKFQNTVSKSPVFETKSVNSHSQTSQANFGQNQKLQNSANSPNSNFPIIFQKNPQSSNLPKWFTKWISRPDWTVPIVTCIAFTIFFFYNFSIRTGGINSETAINSFSVSSERSLTERRIFREILPEDYENTDYENTINHILITGQSLSVGETGFPALSLSQNYENLRMTGGRFEPLIENTTKSNVGENVETIASSFANNVTFASKNQKYQILISNNGLGGAEYAKLKKGTELYQNNINEIIAAQKISRQMGKKYQVPAVLVIHGETDNALGNGPKYSQFLEEWYKDYNTDIKAITGQSNDIFLFTDQMSSFGMDLATPKGIASPSTTLGQLRASLQNPRIILVGPKYFLTYSDNLHLNNLSYRKWGEYFAKAYKQTILNQNSKDSQSWKPLMPIKSTFGGNKIKIQFNIPKKPLILDTENVLAKENYGFEYIDETDENTNETESLNSLDKNIDLENSAKNIPSAKIESVKIVDDSVEITLDKVPTGKNKKIQYGLRADYLQNSPGSGTGALAKGSSGGNLRDSDDSSSLYGNFLWNWAVHFEQKLD